MRMLRMSLSGLLCVGCIALASPASAVVVLNASFESPVVVGTGTVSPTGTGWTGFGSVGILNNTHSSLSGPIVAQDGDQVIFANTGGGVSQAFAETLTAGTDYVLTVGVGTRASDTAAYNIQLFAGTDLLASETGTFADDGMFRDVAVPFWALAGDSRLGQALNIRIESTQVQTLFDNVRLTATTTVIPEPSSLALAGLGMLGVGGFGRRRR